MEFDYSRLRGKIREKYSTERAFAEDLGLGRASLSQKLNGEVDFTQGQIHRAVRLLGIEPREISSYFFTTKVQKHEHDCAR